MKASLTILLAVVLIGMGFTFWQGVLLAPAVAGDGLTTAVAAIVLPAADDEYEYVGSKKCKKCHLKGHKSWATTKMAQAFEILKSGQSAEAKQKAGLDPAKDYTQDETCLACHTTGHGKPGGYAIPDPEDKKALKKAKRLQGVGCESCHGPGSAYNKVFKEIMESKRKYKVEELYAVGLRKIDAATCTLCHNDKSPTYDPAAPFDFEKKKDEDRHEHHPLKQREE